MSSINQYVRIIGSTIIIMLIAFQLQGAVKIFSKSYQKAYEKAAERYFKAVKMEESHTASITYFVEQFVQRNPAYFMHKDYLIKLYNKYIGWSEIKSTYVRIYMSHLSLKELKYLQKIYQTPEGQQIFKKLPMLTAASKEAQEDQLAFTNLKLKMELTAYLRDYEDRLKRREPEPEPTRSQAVVLSPEQEQALSTFKMSIGKGEVLEDPKCNLTGEVVDKHGKTIKIEDDVSDCPGYVKNLKMSNGAELLVGFVQTGDPEQFTDSHLIRTIVNGRVQNFGKCFPDDIGMWVSVDKFDRDQVQIACASSFHGSDPGSVEIKRLQFNPQENKLELIKEYSATYADAEEPIPDWAHFKPDKESSFWIVDNKEGK